MIQDTLAFVRRLTAAGMDPKHAEAIVEGLRGESGDLATRTDLDALRASTKVDLDALRASTKADLDALRASTKTDLDALRGEVRLMGEALRAEFNRAMLIHTGVIVGATVALLKLLP